MVTLRRMIVSCARILVMALATAGAACGGSSTEEPKKDDAVCTDVGFCSATVDVCTCGTSCERLSADHYSCEISCEKDADCTAEKHPITGARFTECATVPGQDRARADSYCR